MRQLPVCIAAAALVALLCAGAAGCWWAMTYQPVLGALDRVSRVGLSALVGGWGSPVAVGYAAGNGWLPETVPTQIAGFQVYADRLVVPAGLLEPGVEYVAVVSAVASPNDGLDTNAPYSGDLPFHLASNVTAVFTP